MLSLANDHLQPEVADVYEVIDLECDSNVVRLTAYRMTVIWSQLSLDEAALLVANGFPHLREK